MPRSIFSPELQSTNLFRVRQEPLRLVEPSIPPVRLNSGAFNKRIQFVDGEMQSRDYVPDVSGWRISDTLIEALNIKARGIIEATSGDIGGWTIDSDGIFQGNSRLSSGGYIAFGNPAPTAYGNNIGSWLGYSSSQARFSLYRDADNYLQWDGTKLLLKSPNFTLDSSGNLIANNSTFTNGTYSGNITSSSGNIGGWTLGVSTLLGTNITLSSAGAIALGSGNNIVQLSSSNATARIWVGNTNPASASFRVSPSGDLVASGATLTSATVSGTINAGAGNFSGNITVSGTLLSGTSGDYFRLQGTNNELRFFESNTERMRLDKRQLTFWNSAGVSSGYLRGETTFGVAAVTSDAWIITAGNRGLGVGFNSISVETHFFNVSGGSPGNVSAFTLVPQGAYAGTFMNPGGAFLFSTLGTTRGFVDSNGNFATISDVRTKRDIKYLEEESMLDLILKIKPVSYKRNHSENKDKKHKLTQLDYDEKTYVSMVAQEVEKEDKYGTLTSDIEGLKAINYSGFVPYLIGAMKALHKRNSELEQAMEILVDQLQEKGVI